MAWTPSLNASSRLVGMRRGFRPRLRQHGGRSRSDGLELLEPVEGVTTSITVEELVDRHLHTPYAYPELREALHGSALDAVRRYLHQHENDLATTLHSEKQIQVHIAPGIVVDGRIDLVRRLETDELSVVDFKSTDRAQPEDVTTDQLHVYAVGYEELTGDRPDLIEVLNLDAEGKSTREQVIEPLLIDVRERIRLAGDSLRRNDLPKHRRWCGSCDRCDLVALCRDRPKRAPGLRKVGQP